MNNYVDYVVAGATVKRYFHTDKIRYLHIICHVLGHNIGTIAWSILLLPALIIKACFGWFEWFLESSNPNGLQSCCNTICSPCCGIYGIFDRITEHYFTVSYFGSIGFCRSIRVYDYLSTKYYDDTWSIILVGEMIAFMGKILIGIGSTYGGYMIYQKNMFYQQSINRPGLLFLLCFFIGFFVGAFFVNMFATAYDATMVCFMLERDIN